jgi:hypothetical protein
MDAPPTYSERLARRRQLWWGRPRQWGKLAAYRDAWHRWNEWHGVRARTDPETLWQCCPYWQRSLLNKTNGREFAARYGVPLPRLYWRGRVLQRVPLEGLPRDFVIRPTRGASRRGVYVIDDGHEILRCRPAPPAAIRHWIRHPRALPWLLPILIEERIRPPDHSHRLPTEFKCHTFAGTVAAVQMVERHDIHKDGVRQRCYTPGWEPFADPISTVVPLADVIAPPPGLEQIVRHAETLGAALGTYMRIDFFLGAQGWVFNEFSSMPVNGHRSTPYGDAFFGALWAERCPDGV